MTRQLNSRLPTMAEAVEIISNCYDRREQIRQLQYMEETQGRTFAEQVRDKVKAAGRIKKA